MMTLAETTTFVIPAKAGIHRPPLKFHLPEMDPRLPAGQFILSGWRATQSKGGGDNSV
jgi:hypothetical protein